MKTLLAACVALLCVSAVYSQTTCDTLIGPYEWGPRFTLGEYKGKRYTWCISWQPAWSKCIGNCGDSWTQLDNDLWGGYSHFCECCRARASLQITPTWVWCWAIVSLEDGCPKITSGWAAYPGHPDPHPNVPDHPYEIVGKCACRPCNPGSGRRKRDVLSFESLERIPGEEPADMQEPTAADDPPPITEDEAREAAEEAGIRVTECELSTRAPVERA